MYLDVRNEKKFVVMLAVTDSCNLNCTYCYEHNKSPKLMTFETAKKIIDYHFSNYEGFDGIEIDFFGGEPFLNFSLIKQCTAYIRENYDRHKYVLFSPTNGTLVHGEIQQWLKENSDIFVCGLSLDGTKEMHDVNRCQSFDKIDIDFFATVFPGQPVKMTVSEESLPYLSDGVIFCHSKGFEVDCNLAFGINWDNPRNSEVLERELYKLMTYYLEHPEIKPSSILAGDIEFLGYNGSKERFVRRWCGAGVDMKSYDTDGTGYMCQFFMPLSAGEEKAKKSLDMHICHDVPLSLLDEKCQNCIVLDLCPTCYGSNYVATNNLYAKDVQLCKLQRITIKARSYFKAMQLQQGQLNDLTEEKKQLLVRSIIKIQEELSTD